MKENYRLLAKLCKELPHSRLNFSLNVLSEGKNPQTLFSGEDIRRRKARYMK